MVRYQLNRVLEKSRRQASRSDIISDRRELETAAESIEAQEGFESIVEVDIGYEQEAIRGYRSIDTACGNYRVGVRNITRGFDLAHPVASSDDESDPQV